MESVPEKLRPADRLLITFYERNWTSNEEKTTTNRNDIHSHSFISSC
ncbi:hypothetical protein OESDEN_05577 [Oesophagostomum dentatum]|uniref:Uncharacterized protein n=1 Tax=Oesophagostomum dentatum TaxID=61180 RepID=A0A0B1TGF6_OESDE|nr:hypothetical protein OESDEN_05577 [Oesophagostomum dentatum]